MLSVSNIAKSYNNRELFSGVSFTIGMSDRIAVIGQNGTGKTTLFEIISGNITPDTGTLSVRRGTTIGYLRQDITPSSTRTLLDEVARSSDAMNRLARKLRQLQEDLAEEKDEETQAALLKELGEVQNLYESSGGYDSEYEASIILSGLGFAESDHHRSLSEFSGGWQTRIELAKLLFLNPDVLILDEPTNHLDLETQRWFENYLKNYHGAVLITSHDRAFLNNVVKKIIAIEPDDVIFFQGNYDNYVLARQKDMETRQATARRQEQHIAKEMRFIDRFRSKATKATQVQSRLKQLDKVQRVTVPRMTKKINFKFPAPARSGHKVITLEHVAKAYSNITVYRDLNLALERGDRAALVGLNGAGKTTLLRMLAGVLPFEGGDRILGHNVTTAYFAQYYIESLNPANTVLDELRQVAPDEPDQSLRGLLGAFLFTGDDVTKEIGVLSGGEKTRVAIAKMLTRPANFILLDEPTNHLDIPSREILADALGNYKGTICFITHDRTLIRDIATKIIEVKDGGIRVFNGSYDEYLSQSESPVMEVPETLRIVRRVSPPDGAGRARQKQRKALEGELRNRHYREIAPVNKEINRVEYQVAAATSRLEELEKMIADPEHYKDSRNVVAVNREYREVKNAIAALTGQWDRLTAEAERMKNDFRQEMRDLESGK
ncbi:MAG: ABC-F family ATP-binding cassette domain-containing protein [Dehalococcoidales bacterium]|nr:ABC-F family ATP-binding cassette domain-containing protein [Dehalococcoidales bacterium]